MPDGAMVKTIEWEADAPAKTWVKAQVRYATTEAGLADARWIGADGAESWLENGQTVGAEADAGPWVQYRLALGAINSLSTPRVTSVTLSFETT